MAEEHVVEEHEPSAEDAQPVPLAAPEAEPEAEADELQPALHEAADAAAAPAAPCAAPVHLQPLRPAPPTAGVHRVVRAAFAATGLREILGQHSASEVEAITVQIVGVTPLAGAVQGHSQLRFVLRFYDFTPAVTPPVTLQPLGAGHAPHVVVSGRLGERVGGAVSPERFAGTPGVVVRFEVGGDAAESARLGRYVRLGGCLQVEAWDDVSLLHVGTARVPLAELAQGKAEVWHEAALLEPVLPLQDERHAGRCCGLLQLRVAHCSGHKKHTHAPKKIAEPVQPHAPSGAKAGAGTRRKKDPTETERKLLRLQRLQASRFSTTDAERLDAHHELDDVRSASRTSAIKQTLEAAAEQHVTVNCCAGTEPFFEYKLTNLQHRKQKFTVTCSSAAMGLTSAHHQGAVLEMVMDTAHCKPAQSDRIPNV